MVQTTLFISFHYLSGNTFTLQISVGTETFCLLISFDCNHVYEYIKPFSLQRSFYPSTWLYSSMSKHQILCGDFNVNRHFILFWIFLCNYQPLVRYLGDKDCQRFVHRGENALSGQDIGVKNHIIQLPLCYYFDLYLNIPFIVLKSFIHVDLSKLNSL